MTTGLRFFVNDHLSESPKIINALKRFNLYPEVKSLHTVTHLIVYNLEKKKKKKLLQYGDFFATFHMFGICC